MDILTKIKQANLVGRGGAGFPTWQKWSSVAEALADKQAVGEKNFYVVCNGAEGEPGVTKDGYILEHYADKVIDGLKIAINFLSTGAQAPAAAKALAGRSADKPLGSARDRRDRRDKSAVKGYLFLNYAYNKKLNKKLTALLKDSAIEIFVKPIKAGYIGGEESAVLNAIEGRRIEPRLKPPFPVTNGLWNSPTLINNVETFYNVSLVNSGQYGNKRFYSISGDCPREGVYELASDFTIEKILKTTGNFPRFAFFAQIGGGSCGQALNSRQLKTAVCGAGSIWVYSLVKNDFKKTIKGWLDFFVNESCGQCTPCREGIFRLKEVFLAEKIDWVLFNNLQDLRTLKI